MKPSSSDDRLAVGSADPIDALIRTAEAARDRDDTAAGLAASRHAWANLGTDDDAQRLRVGPLLTHFLHRNGDLPQMVDHGLAMLPVLRRQEHPGKLIDLLRDIALNASDHQRFDVALACAQEAQAKAAEIGDAARLSLAINALGCLFERLGDPWQGERLLQRALVLARAQPESRPLYSALTNLSVCLVAKFYLLRDALTQEDAGEPLRTALPFAIEAVANEFALSNTLYSVIAMSNLGEIRVLLGDADGAQTVLDTAQTLADAHGFRAQSWYIRYTLGDLLLLRGRHEDAWTAFQEVLARADRFTHPVIRMRLHHALWRCALALGRTADAAAHLEHYFRQDRTRAVSQLRAQSELFVTRAEVENIQLEAQRQQLRSIELEADALRDQLTGLSNRRELDLRWPKLVDETRERGTPLSVAMLDLDHFKQVNDCYGHAVGDQVLAVLADLLRAHTRGSDLAVRVGGEEFLLVLPHATLQAAGEVCERVRRHVAAYDWGQIAAGLTVTISGGICSAPAVDINRLRQRADEALYQAKREGRNRLVLAESA